MREAYVELECPECERMWEENANRLPEEDEEFECPDCGNRQRLLEFARTKNDLKVMEEL